MLEVCPSIAAGRPRLEIHPLSIGGKADPVRLVFDAHPGTAIAACDDRHGRALPDGRDASSTWSNPPQPLPKLPVARAVWRPRPDLQTNAAAWIPAGGSHHTSLGYDVTAEQLSDFAAMCGIEFLVIDDDTRTRGLPRPRCAGTTCTTTWRRGPESGPRPPVVACGLDESVLTSRRVRG